MEGGDYMQNSTVGSDSHLEISHVVVWPANILIVFSTVNLQFQRRQWHPTPVLLPGKSHGWKSLVGCSPWGRWGSDTTEWLHFDFLLSCIEGGNGNPLQCSCLENPRDGGAAISGVAQSRTRLKWLSSSNSFLHVSPSILATSLYCKLLKVGPGAHSSVCGHSNSHN